MSEFHRSKKWRITAARFKREQLIAGKWLCRKCGADGRYIPLQVDHVRPIHRGGTAYAFSNLQPLCYLCHTEKSAREREDICPRRQKWIDLVGF
ncbi:MAG: HNH endonuclease [Rhodothermaceae bacterium]|nr:HNH endonuclease [Rhodothermaceae bacterium]MYF79857.1 HNH endonuclease [Chloroflexota bacterium]